MSNKKSDNKHSWMDREPWTVDEMEKQIKILNEILEKRPYHSEYDGNDVARFDDGSFPI